MKNSSTFLFYLQPTLCGGGGHKGRRTRPRKRTIEAVLWPRKVRLGNNFAGISRYSVPKWACALIY